MDWLAFVVAAALGALVGGGELVSRYRASPWTVVQRPPGVLYLALNSGASLAALAATRGFAWNFGFDPVSEADALLWTQVVVAGTGALALFRSSLFTVRVGDDDVAVGPITFLQVILSALDREVDRTEARARSAKLAALMRPIDFEKAKVALPAYCLALMQNVTQQEQDSLAGAIAGVDEIDSSNLIKVTLLGTELLNLVGDGVLVAAIEALGDDIKTAE